MADGIDQVSVEAHERVKGERDKFRTDLQAAQEKIAELSATVVDYGTVERLRSTFKELGAEDPDWAAEVALPHVRDVSEDKLKETLETRFGRLYAPSASSPPVRDETAVESSPPPSFARPTPNAEGVEAAETKLPWSHPDIQRAIQEGDRQFLDDRLAWRTKPDGSVPLLRTQ